MATIQSRILSGRYRTELLCSHWSNSTGNCHLSTSCQNQPENVEHILRFCSALQPTRKKLFEFTRNYCADHTLICDLVDIYMKLDSPYFCQFLVDCSILPEVIKSVQHHGSIIHHHLFNITRIWCYAIHRERLKILGRWNIK